VKPDVITKRGNGGGEGEGKRRWMGGGDGNTHGGINFLVINGQALEKGFDR